MPLLLYKWKLNLFCIVRILIKKKIGLIDAIVAYESMDTNQ